MAKGPRRAATEWFVARPRLRRQEPDHRPRDPPEGHGEGRDPGVRRARQSVGLTRWVAPRAAGDRRRWGARGDVWSYRSGRTRRVSTGLGGRPVSAQILWASRRYHAPDGIRVAYLYDRTQANPKRTASPAQMAAVAKACAARRSCPTCRRIDHPRESRHLHRMRPSAGWKRDGHGSANAACRSRGSREGGRLSERGGGHMREPLGEVSAVMGWPRSGVEASITRSPRLFVLGEVDGAEHARRVDEGRLPVADSFLLRCICHDDPGFATRPSPVHVRAVVAVRRQWQSALGAVGDFTAFAPRIIAVPDPQARTDRVTVETITTGVGVISTNVDSPWQLVHPPAPMRVTPRTWVHRWVEESIYDAFLAYGAGGCQPDGRTVKRRTNP